MQVLDLQRPAAISHDAPTALCDKPRTLKEAVHAACAVRHYSPRTFDAYWRWIKCYVHHTGKRPPRELGAAEVGAFLSWLASDRQVSASTQRQALAAVLFLYQKVLEMEIGWVDNIVRAKQPVRLPTVLTVDETRALLAHTSGTPGLFLRLLYGTGMRIAEGQNLRVKDLEICERRLTIRSGKGDKDRVVMLPGSLATPLTLLLQERRRGQGMPRGQGHLAARHAQARRPAGRQPAGGLSAAAAQQPERDARALRAGRKAQASALKTAPAMAHLPRWPAIKKRQSYAGAIGHGASIGAIAGPA